MTIRHRCRRDGLDGMRHHYCRRRRRQGTTSSSTQPSSNGPNRLQIEIEIERKKHRLGLGCTWIWARAGLGLDMDRVSPVHIQTKLILINYSGALKFVQICKKDHRSWPNLLAGLRAVISSILQTSAQIIELWRHAIGMFFRRAFWS